MRTEDIRTTILDPLSEKGHRLKKYILIDSRFLGIDKLRFCVSRFITISQLVLFGSQRTPVRSRHPLWNSEFGWLAGFKVLSLEMWGLCDLLCRPVWCLDFIRWPPYWVTLRFSSTMDVSESQWVVIVNECCVRRTFFFLEGIGW